MADELRDLRDDGVAEPSKAVHSAGNPIIHSTNTGFGVPPMARLRSTMDGVPHPFAYWPDRRFRSARSFAAIHAASDLPSYCVCGVGNNPNSIPRMRGADGGSWNTVPDRIIPERGKVSENGSHPETEQTCDVFHNDELWSYFANDPAILFPKTRSRTFDARSLSSSGNVLAREPAADDIDGNSVSSKSVGCEVSNVMVDRNIGPVFRQHAAGVVLDFAEGDSLKAARALQAKAESRRCPKKDQAL